MFRTSRLVIAGLVTAMSASAFAAATAAHASSDGTGTTQVLVKFQPTATASDEQAIVSSVSGTDVGTVRDLGVHVLKVPSTAVDQVVAALSHRSDVQYAEVDGTTTATVTPNDPGWGAQWGLGKVNAPTAWNTTTGSSSVVIATLDSGVDYTHPDLQGRFVAGYDFVNNDTDPTDDYGHGTSVAGVVGAATNNATGMAGVCWSCAIMPVKVLDASGNGNVSAVANGITWATDHGAQVISMSLVTSTNDATLHNAVQYAHNHGVVLVAAAGNAGTSSVNYPAGYAEVLGVAGTQSSDALYSWSNYGSWVKVAAPGCDYATLMGGSYGTFCGTSAATPVVAGVVGLLRSSAPAATNSQIESAIETSSVSIGSVVAYGRVDAAAALTALSTGGSTGGTGGGGGTGGTGGTTSTTSTYSGSFSNKSTSSRYSVTAGAGTLSASLSYSKASSMTLQLLNSAGSVMASSSTGNPVTLSASVSAGAYTLVVSGPSRSSFTLSVTYPNP